jgi:hypothetical protein
MVGGHESFSHLHVLPSFSGYFNAKIQIARPSATNPYHITQRHNAEDIFEFFTTVRHSNPARLTVISLKIVISGIRVKLCT